MVAESKLLRYGVIGKILSRLVVDNVWILLSRPACFAAIGDHVISCPLACSWVYLWVYLNAGTQIALDYNDSLLFYI